MRKSAPAKVHTIHVSPSTRAPYLFLQRSFYRLLAAHGLSFTRIKDAPHRSTADLQAFRRLLLTVSFLLHHHTDYVISNIVQRLVQIDIAHYRAVQFKHLILNARLDILGRNVIPICKERRFQQYSFELRNVPRP